MTISDRIGTKVRRLWRSLLYSLNLESSLYNHQQPKDVVLMFHNIFSRTNHDLNFRNIGSADFDRILDYIKRKYEVVSLRELLDSTSSNARIAITFDDGLVNNLNHAFPLLVRHEIPATFFVSTSLLHGKNILWPDRLSRLLMKVGESFIYKEKNFHRVYRNQFRSETDKMRLEDWLMIQSENEIEEFLKFLENFSGFTVDSDHRHEDEWRVMKGEEVKIISNHPLMDIGSHGISHFSLPTLDEETLLEELTESKTYLEQVTGKSIDMLAFPFGAYSEKVLAESGKAGYKHLIAVTKNDLPDVKSSNLVFRLGLYNDESVTEMLHRINLAFE